VSEGGMTSISAAVTESERQAEHIRRCLRLWNESLGAVEKHVLPLHPEAGQKSIEDWRQVRRCLADGTPTEVIDSTPRLLERVLHNYAMEARQSQREELDAVKVIVAAMAEATGATRVRTAHYSESFRDTSEALAALAELEDPNRLRAELRKSAERLRESVAAMAKENEEAIRNLEQELAGFQEKLAEAEAAASTDALTGLANRRELERQLDLRVRRMKPFSVMLFDLNGFKSINDRFGHDAGDQILRAFGRALNDQVRPGDVVARWGGDEFFVIFDCGIEDALRRSKEISKQVSRRYEIQWNGKRLGLPVHACSGVVEYELGEAATEVVRRADRAMYAAKAAMKPAAPPC
jgi:diguanylate cyclase (GGDEF)-like protein